MPVFLSEFRSPNEFPFHEINFNERARFRNPEIYDCAMEAVASWSGVEKAMLQLYVFLVRGNSDRAAASIMAVNDFRTKCFIVAAAAKGAISERRFETLKKLLSVALKSKRRSDLLTSWTWGYSDALPDALLLVAPTIDSLDAVSTRDVLVYPKRDIENMKSENSRITEYLQAYKRIALLEGDREEANERLFEWLER